MARLKEAFFVILFLGPFSTVILFGASFSTCMIHTTPHRLDTRWEGAFDIEDGPRIQWRIDKRIPMMDAHEEAPFDINAYAAIRFPERYPFPFSFGDFTGDLRVRSLLDVHLMTLSVGGDALGPIKLSRTSLGADSSGGVCYRLIGSPNFSCHLLIHAPWGDLKGSSFAGAVLGYIRSIYSLQTGFMIVHRRYMNTERWLVDMHLLPIANGGTAYIACTAKPRILALSLDCRVHVLFRLVHDRWHGFGLGTVTDILIQRGSLSFSFRHVRMDDFPGIVSLESSAYGSTLPKQEMRVIGTYDFPWGRATISSHDRFMREPTFASESQRRELLVSSDVSFDVSGCTAKISGELDLRWRSDGVLKRITRYGLHVNGKAGRTDVSLKTCIELGERIELASAISLDTYLLPHTRCELFVDQKGKSIQGGLSFQFALKSGMVRVTIAASGTWEVSYAIDRGG